jgi:hypothetical protein
MKIICNPVDNKELLKTQDNKYYFDEKIDMVSFSDNVIKQMNGKEAIISYQGYSPMTKFEKYDDSITITLSPAECEVKER